MSSSASAFTSLVAPVAALQAELLYTAQRVAEDHGLTAARWQVLSAAGAEPSSVADIAHGLGLARQSVQRVADDLVAAGLATWAPNPRHARAKLLVPSTTGRQKLADAAAAQTAWMVDVENRMRAASLDGSAIATAVDVLNTVIDSSEEHWAEATETSEADSRA
ncbi:MAG: MarR family winged helix-turn-helix transcriptional regulator [Galactobacter sp.]|uniref:MarR family winged helix-turn-helix transcriptional regulator n=1 Tax=Galactobacter sp. TaxID=2676125 RepID=UPI0025BEB398|nr:helix-turn-helix domain-containing protein [Galactobacter sp.]